SPWTPARLVLRPIRTDRRIVRLLRLPGDDPVLDVDLPRARAGAVDAVRGTDDLVVAPSVAVEGIGLPPTRLLHHPQVVGDLRASEEPAGADQRIGQVGLHGHRPAPSVIVDVPAPRDARQ